VKVEISKPVEMAWKPYTETSYTEQVTHYAKTLTSFLPSSLRPGIGSAVEVSEASFHRVVMVEGPVRLVLCVCYGGGGAAAWEVRQANCRLLLFAPSASKILPLWVPPSGKDVLEAQRPLFVCLEGDSLLSVRGAEAAGKPLMQLRCKQPVDEIATCARGLVVLAGGRATL
jgi:hypothetical protein